MDSKIMKADSADSERLSEIAWQAKSHWNYPKEWMELWKEGLKITPKIIEENDVFKVVLNDKEIVACTVLITEKDILWIEHLWVDPKFIGQGFGRKLLQKALSDTVEPIHKIIKVISDKNAENFYEKMGFTTVDQYESVPKGRFLPIMERPVY